MSSPPRHTPSPPWPLRIALGLVRAELLALGAHGLAAALELYPWQQQAFIPVLGSLASGLALLVLAVPLLAAQRALDDGRMAQRPAARLGRRGAVFALLCLIPALLTAGASALWIS